MYGHSVCVRAKNARKQCYGLKPHCVCCVKRTQHHAIYEAGEAGRFYRSPMPAVGPEEPSLNTRHICRSNGGAMKGAGRIRPKGLARIVYWQSQT